MSCIQMAQATGSVHTGQDYGNTSRSSSFVEFTPPTSYTGSLIEASGDIPLPQAPCSVEKISASVESLARSRVLAVMALNIFVYETGLNPHCDRWICPFSNCKRGFSDPKKMMFHAAICTHVSAHGAFCNCCCSYYDFPSEGPAHPTPHGDNAPPTVKPSAMTKGKKKIIDLISRCSGSASSSREQVSTLSSSKSFPSFEMEFPLNSTVASRQGSMVSDLSTAGPSSGHQPSGEVAELCADDPIAEIDTFGAFPNHPVFLSNTDLQTQQLSVGSTVSMLSTMGYPEPMGTDCGDLCMSPTEYYTPHIYNDTSQQPFNGNISYGTDERSPHQTQSFDSNNQSFSWNMGSRRFETEWNSSTQSVMPSQEVPASDLIVDVRNFSLPFYISPSTYTGEMSGSDARYPNGHAGVSADVVAQSECDSGQGFAFSSYEPHGYNFTEAGIASNNLQQFDITESPVATASISPIESPASSSFSWNGDFGLRCLECKYEPRGAVATRRTRLKRHIQNIHVRTDVWPCKRCGYPFTRKDNLGVHLGGVDCGKGKTRQHSANRRRNQIGRLRQT